MWGGDWEEEGAGALEGKAPLLILYSSKGCPGQAAAMEVHATAVEEGIAANVTPLKLFVKAGFLTSPVVVLCTDGMTPTDGTDPGGFWKLLSADVGSAWLRGMRHVCVGDDAFAATAFSARLASLGSLPAVPAAQQRPGCAGVEAAFLCSNLALLPDDDGLRPAAALPKRRADGGDGGPPPKVQRSTPDSSPSAAASAAPAAAAAAAAAATPTPAPPAPAAEAPAATGSKDAVRNLVDGTLLVTLRLQKKTERLGPRFEQKDGTKDVYCKAVKKGTICEGLGVVVGMQALAVDGVGVEGEVGLQKQLEVLRENLGGKILFKMTDEQLEELEEEAEAREKERARAAAAAAVATAAAAAAAAQPAAAPTPTATRDINARTLLITLVLQTKTERLGMRHEQSDADSKVYVTSVKKGSMCDSLGVVVGMEVAAVDGAPVEGEVSLGRNIDKLRGTLGGTIFFRVPGDVDFDYRSVPAQKAAPALNLPSATPSSFAPAIPTKQLPKLPAKKEPVVFLYGSETGNAECICHEMQKDARDKGWPTRFGKMNEFESLQWDGENTGGVVLVVATTGDGEIPDNGKKFLRFLKKKAQKGAYGHVKYAVLALGDQNYDKFCHSGKQVDQLMAEAGCQRFADTGLADDGTGLEIVVEPWKAALQGKLLEANGLLDNKTAQQVQYEKLRTSEGAERSILIMYGSETGNGEAIARGIHEVAVSSNIKSTLCPANEYKKRDWESFAVVILIMATTGDGNYCENASSFCGFIGRNSHKPTLLSGMKFAVLALGNSSYPKFCGAGKNVDKRMEELGATRFYATGLADDEYGLEVVVEPWKQKLWPALLSLWTGDQLSLSPALKSVLRASPSAGPLSPPTAAAAAALAAPALLGVAADAVAKKQASATFSDKSSEMSYDLKHGQLNPFYAKITGFEVMADVPETPTYKLTFDVSQGGIEWTPGDSIGVCPCNDEANVDEIVRKLSLGPHDDFKRPSGVSAEDIAAKTRIYDSIRFPLTNRQVLLRHVDMLVRRPEFLKYLANQCSQKADREVLLSWCASTRLFRDRVSARRISILDIFDRFPSCAPEFRGLVENCTILQPRYYSVASAMVADPTHLDICFNVHVHRSQGAKEGEVVKGVASSWLQGLIKAHQRSPEADISVPMFLKAAPEFSPPDDVSSPIIMIGPGTGIAPFMGFLQHRQWQVEQAGKEGVSLAVMPANGGSMVSFPSTDELAQAMPQQPSPPSVIPDLLSDPPKVVGESHLFFGCRSRNIDYLFKYDSPLSLVGSKDTTTTTCNHPTTRRDELERYASNHTLRYLHTAFSQEEDDAYWYGGVYVQDKMMV